MNFSMNVSNALITAIFGYALVFVGLILLMSVLFIVGAIFKFIAEKAVSKFATVTSDVTTIPTTRSVGHIKLNGVPDREAAMIITIVAEKLKIPLNELKFISINEVK